MKEHCAALGMAESTSIGLGIEAADHMLKAAQVEPVFVKTICPGKFIIAVSGDVAAVNAALDAGKECLGASLVDWFSIANLHREVLMAMSSATLSPEPGALGILETFSASSIVLAADAAVKAANISLLDVRIAMGLGGKGYALISGDVASVQAAVDAGAKEVEASGLLASRVVIPQPAAELWRALL